MLLSVMGVSFRPLSYTVSRTEYSPCCPCLPSKGNLDLILGSSLQASEGQCPTHSRHLIVVLVSSTSEPGASFDCRYFIVIHIFLWAVSLPSSLRQELPWAQSPGHLPWLHCGFPWLFQLLQPPRASQAPSARQRVPHRGSFHKCVLTK